jgi:hypothetical protein
MYEKDIESLRSQLLSMQQEQKELRDVVRRHHSIMDRVMST